MRTRVRIGAPVLENLALSGQLGGKLPVVGIPGCVCCRAQGPGSLVAISKGQDVGSNAPGLRLTLQDCRYQAEST